MYLRMQRAMQVCGLAVAGVLMLAADWAQAEWVLDLGRTVQARGVDIIVPGYSVPSFVDWNSDGLKDLIVGEGGNYRRPAVRIYLNEGTAAQSQFSGFFYVRKSDGSILSYPGYACICRPLGLFPRVVDWNNDQRKDLLVGQLDGTVRVYQNIGADESPVFDDGVLLQVGTTSKSKIDVGDIAAPAVVDWNGDGRKDLLVGAENGRVRCYLNEGTDAEPDFRQAGWVRKEDGSILVVSHEGASPVALDVDGDGRKDVISGNTPGELLLYRNVGSDDAPSFSGYSHVEADGAPIAVATGVDAATGASPRSRPFVCDWNSDGYLDVLIGAGDGRVYLYQGVPEAGTLGLLVAGAVMVLRRQCRRSRR